MSAATCPKCGGELHAVSGPAWMNREQWDASKAGDYYCTKCVDANTRSGCAYFSEADLGRVGSKPSGVETVRAELLADGVSWPVDAGLPARVDLLFRRAERFYNAYAQEGVRVDGAVPLGWDRLCTLTVRKWVAVAREAGRL